MVRTQSSTLGAGCTVSVCWLSCPSLSFPVALFSSGSRKGGGCSWLRVVRGAVPCATTPCVCTPVVSGFGRFRLNLLSVIIRQTVLDSVLNPMSSPIPSPGHNPNLTLLTPSIFTLPARAPALPPPAPHPIFPWCMFAPIWAPAQARLDSRPSADVACSPVAPVLLRVDGALPEPLA